MERGEIVNADKDLRSAVHRREIEMVADQPAVAVVESRGDLAIQYAIFVHARAGSTTRIEVVGRN